VAELSHTDLGFILRRSPGHYSTIATEEVQEIVVYLKYHGDTMEEKEKEYLDEQA
jgi:hypothetical protein